MCLMIKILIPYFNDWHELILFDIMFILLIYNFYMLKLHLWCKIFEVKLAFEMFESKWLLGHFLLTWFDFNPSMDKYSHAQ